MKKRILFIEDEQVLGDVLTKKLQGAGYEVTLVRDGGEGLKQIGAQKPDLILLDIILPTMNGYEILEERKKDPSLAGIPVIIISNSGQPIEIDRALALGVKDYLVKAQIEPEEVIAKVRAYVGEGESAVADPAAQHLAHHKILWVEDDQFLSSILAVKLSHEGCTGLYAKNGEEALGILDHETPDAILLDLLLPGMSGFEFLKAVRANPRLSHVPVIILSNLGQKEDIEKTKELGASKYLVKAEHDLDDIVNEVAKTLAETKAAAPAA